MLGLITDRTQANVDRLRELAAKGWSNMTVEERAEWSGNPLLTVGANLIPRGENFSIGTSVQYRGSEIVVSSNWDGSYIYAILMIGPASDYVGKTMTLSLDSFYSSGGSPQAALYWHDANGYEYAGASLTEAGSVTFTATDNAAGRANLVLYLYATTDATITAGDYVIYKKLMLEMGETKHEYAPHYAVLPTAATKGAYNYSDLNRVEWAIAELATSAAIPLTTKTNWTAWDLPKRSDMARILRNIETLRRAFPLPPSVPKTPGTMERFTFSQANDIETILSHLAESANAVFRSGELYAGEI